MSTSDDESRSRLVLDVQDDSWPEDVDPAGVKCLRLSGTRVRTLPAGMRNLEEIAFYRCEYPIELPPDLVSLKIMTLSFCALPPVDGLLTLVELEISSATNTEIDVSSASLKKLKLNSCDEMKSLTVRAPNLYSFDIDTSRNLREMTFGDMHRLRVLRIHACQNLQRVTWPKDPFRRLGNLSIYQSNVNVFEIASYAAHTIERLEVIQSECDELPDDMRELRDLSVVQQLKWIDRPRDRLRVMRRLPRGMTNLERLTLMQTDVSEIPSDVTRLRFLTLFHSPVRDLYTFTNVVGLECRCMPELERLPERMPLAASLNVADCPRVRSMPFDVPSTALVSLRVDVVVVVPFRLCRGSMGNENYCERDETVYALVRVVPALDRVRVPEDVRRALHEFLVPKFNLR